MRIDFRQGILRYQTDGAGNPIFLQKNTGGPFGLSIDIYVSPEPTLFTVADGNFPQSDYLFVEDRTIVSAWIGPFSTGVDYWLYWDLELQTGVRTFGHTELEPITSPIEPQNPVEGQHWFDLTVNYMKVFGAGNWRRVLRLFSGKLEQGSILIPYILGSQVGLNVTSNAGYLLFDDENKPVKKFNKFNLGRFITTDIPLASQSSRLANLRLETIIISAQATETIPQWSLVSYTNTPREIQLAKFSVPEHPAIGIAAETIVNQEVNTFITGGYIVEYNWNWNYPPDTPIFVGANGELMPLTPPASISIQQVGRIVGPATIYLDIQPVIFLE